MSRKVVVDGDLCTGCELCVETAPDVFHMDGDVAVAVNSADMNEDEIEEAITNCPVEAISWEE